MDLEQLKKGNELNAEIRDVKHDVENLKKALQKKVLEPCFSIKNYSVKVNCDNSNFNLNEERFYKFLNIELELLKEYLNKLETEFKNI